MSSGIDNGYTYLAEENRIFNVYIINIHINTQYITDCRGVSGFLNKNLRVS